MIDGQHYQDSHTNEHNESHFEQNKLTMEETSKAIACPEHKHAVAVSQIAVPLTMIPRV